MSDLVENGIVSQQPAQGADMNGPQQHQFRQQQHPKPATSPSQQGQLIAGQTSGNAPSQHSTGGRAGADDTSQIAEHNSSSYDRHQETEYLRGGGQHRQRQHNNNNMSQQHNYSHQQHYNSKHNINNNNNSNNNQLTHSKGDNESNVNHVLLITVINPHYPITCEIIHLVCSNYGKVNRIVIFKKNGVQAMVEFDNVESAKRARSLLHGCDIYSGCCTLRVEYAKQTRLNVHKNDNESFDYTNPNLGSNGGSNEQDQHSSHHNQHHHHHQNYQNHAATHQQQQHTKGGHMHTTSRSVMSGGDMISPSGNSGIGQHQQHAHHSHHSGHLHGNHPKHHHQSTPVPPNSTGPHHHAHLYGIANSQSASADLGLQQQQSPSQEGFGVSRSSAQVQVTGSSATSGTTTSQPEPSDNYVGVDPFAVTSSAHGMQTDNVFSRHENQNQHHHHHHAHPHQHHHHRPQRMDSSGSGSINLHHHAHHPPHNHHHHHHHHPNHHSAFSPQNAALMASSAGLSSQGTVMMVYGLNPDRVNCDRLFNLFCLYGNVVRVKFLRTKEGCAMVQMGDVLAVDRCVSSLNKITLFGNDLQISYSKQAFLRDVRIQPYLLPDGSPSFKDYMGNKNNRFKNPELASKNRISPPSQVLHFFNAPLGISEEELIHLFKQSAEIEPISLKIFTPKTENSKSDSGLVTFRDPVEATEALVLCNHLSMPRAGSPHPYILRLCFSPSTYAKQIQQQQLQQVVQEVGPPAATSAATQLTNHSASTSATSGAAAPSTPSPSVAPPPDP